MAAQHQAAWIPGVGKSLEVGSAPTQSPGPDQVLVRVKAAGINPVDHIVQTYGLIVQTWPFVLGSDIAGEVVEVGSSVTKFQKGDRVLGATVHLMSGKVEMAGFQELAILPEVALAKIPSSVSFVDATVLPLSVATAACGLYQKDQLALPLPSTSPKPTGKKLLIWGGASSVGCSAVQLAVASGFEVIVTASPKNFDLIKSLAKGGKCKLFDYNSPSIVGDLTDELRDGCVGVYDAISTRDTQLACATILAQLGGGTIAATREPPTDELPATVTSTWIMAPVIFNPGSNVGADVFNEYLPAALESGQFVPAPKADVYGTGLDKVQGAMDKHKAGVSASKIVVEL